MSDDQNIHTTGTLTFEWAENVTFNEQRSTKTAIWNFMRLKGEEKMLSQLNKGKGKNPSVNSRRLVSLSMGSRTIWTNKTDNAQLQRTDPPTRETMLKGNKFQKKLAKQILVVERELRQLRHLQQLQQQQKEQFDLSRQHLMEHQELQLQQQKELHNKLKDDDMHVDDDAWIILVELSHNGINIDMPPAAHHIYFFLDIFFSRHILHVYIYRFENCSIQGL